MDKNLLANLMVNPNIPGDLWKEADLIQLSRNVPSQYHQRVYGVQCLRTFAEQNRGVSTEDLKVLHVGELMEAKGGQFYVLQINEAAENIFNIRLKRKNESQQPVNAGGSQYAIR